MKKSIFKSRLLKISELQCTLARLKAALVKEKRNLSSMEVIELVKSHHSIWELKNDSIYVLYPHIIDYLVEEYALLMTLYAY